jgi:glutamine amidotransferase
MRVVLADYGAGNLQSVASALVRAGAEPSVSIDAGEVANAPLTVIAGVGHVESAARGLARHGLDDALRERVASGRPVLGICVGLQLFFGESEEGGRGLDLLAGRVQRLQARRVPHMGWNQLEQTRPTPLLEGVAGEDVYFAHSYAVVPESEVTTAVANHGGPVVAAIERDTIAGVQFHPERSGHAGARLLENALTWSRSV